MDTEDKITHGEAVEMLHEAGFELSTIDIQNSDVHEEGLYICEYPVDLFRCNIENTIKKYEKYHTKRYRNIMLDDRMCFGFWGIG